MTMSPTLGRWLEEDPIGFAGGDPNLYRAVGNNPQNRLDPSGLSEIVLERLPDGRRDAVYYVPEFIGWNVSGFRTWVGTHDPQTGRVYRGDRSVPLARVQQLGHGSLGSTPNWPQVFRDEGETAESLRGARGDAGLGRMQSMADFPRAFDPNVNGREAGRMAIDAGWSVVQEAAASGVVIGGSRFVFSAQGGWYNATARRAPNPTEMQALARVQARAAGIAATIQQQTANINSYQRMRAAAQQALASATGERRRQLEYVLRGINAGLERSTHAREASRRALANLGF